MGTRYSALQDCLRDGSPSLTKRERERERVGFGFNLNLKPFSKTLGRGGGGAWVFMSLKALCGFGSAPELHPASSEVGDIGFGFRVQGSGFRVQGSGFRV